VTRRALLVDLDGTLADSLGVMRAVYDRFLARFGLTGTDEEFTALNGPPTTEVVRALHAAHALPGSQDSLMSTFLGLVAEAYGAVEPSPGAGTLLGAARQAGWATGVVTSGPSGPARDWLRAAGLFDLVDEVVGGDMVSRGKPDPEPYVTALRGLSAPAEGSVAVEDSAPGVAAAVGAGLRTFLYRPGAPDGEAMDGVAGVVTRLDELTWIFA
jgi:HAD superfamily hydrolase (TIGR01509 family)